MTFRAYELRKNLYRKEVKRETKQVYLDGVQYLKEQGREILAIVCDGKKGYYEDFERYRHRCVFSIFGSDL